MFIDTHAHIQDDMLKDRVIEIVASAKENNVGKIVCASYDLSSSDTAVEFANKFEGVFATVGVHPENCEYYNLDVERKLIELCKDKKVIAIGEIGLDYHYTKENKERQKEVFEKQILLADKLSLPVVIHTRDAIGDTLEIVRKNKDKLKKGGVFHCFHESKEVLNEIISLGFYVSYGGVITFNNANSLREIVAYTPVERILTETDCPYMAPVPHRGERNSSIFLCHVAEKIAEIKGVSVQQVEDVTYENALRIYDKSKKDLIYGIFK